MGDFLYKSDSDNLQIIKSSKTVIIDLSTLSFFEIDFETICADGLLSEIMEMQRNISHLYTESSAEACKESMVHVMLRSVRAL